MPQLPQDSQQKLKVGGPYVNEIHAGGFFSNGIDLQQDAQKTHRIFKRNVLAETQPAQIERDGNYTN